MNLAFKMVKTASGVYTLTFRRNNVTSSPRRESMNNMTAWYLHLNVNIFVNNWISWLMKTYPRSWKTRLLEYVKLRKSIFYDLRALFSRRQSYTDFPRLCSGLLVYEDDFSVLSFINQILFKASNSPSLIFCPKKIWDWFPQFFAFYEVLLQNPLWIIIFTQF